jgi:phosphoribosylglycinamide formyltransferase-1
MLPRRFGADIGDSGSSGQIGPRTLAAFTGRIINTHPAPLPAFGGPGMYGERVHQAVLTAGLRQSAATIHLIDVEYDSGPVIAERPVLVRSDDTAETLQQRVQAAERDLLVSTLAALINNPGKGVDGQ